MASKGKIDVAIIMGSDSDLPHVEGAIAVLKKFGVAHEVRVISAHRSPARLHEYVRKAETRGATVFIAAAGGAAHLPGVIASVTARPVLGIPVHTSSFQGYDSLLSILQMPGGVPVATMPVGKAGARNAALFAVQILGVRDPKLDEMFKAFKAEQAEEVAQKDAALQKKLT